MTYLATPVCGELVVFSCVLVRDRIPHRLVVELRMVGRMGNSSKRRRNHHSLDGWNISLDRIENSLCAVDSRVQDLLDGVGEVIVEGRGRMNDIVVSWSRFEDLSTHQQ